MKPKAMRSKYVKEACTNSTPHKRVKKLILEVPGRQLAVVTVVNLIEHLYRHNNPAPRTFYLLFFILFTSNKTLFERPDYGFWAPGVSETLICVWQTLILR